MAMKPLVFSVLQISTIGDAVEARKKNRTEAYINSVPNQILAEILSRVPAKTLFCCTTVSKLWLSVISDPLFKVQHYSRAQVCPLLIVDTPYSERKPNTITIGLGLVEGESISDLVPQTGSNKLISEFEMCFAGEVPITQTTSGTFLSLNGTATSCGGVIAGEVPITQTTSGTFLSLNGKATSCEGVICSSLRHCSGGRDHVVISNPVTGEYVMINLFYGSPDENLQGFFYVFIGLGFSRVDNKFKLLRVSHKPAGDDDEGLVQDISLLEHCIVGSKAWKPIEVSSMPSISFMRKVDDVIYVNGAIYWCYLGDDSICCFDFDVNEFQVIPLPETNDVAVEANSFITVNMRMGVLRGSLCVSLVCPNDGHVELWIIEKHRGSRTYWRKVFNIDTQGTAMEQSGYLRPRGLYKPIKSLRCGKVLLHDWHKTFLIYDPVTKIDRMFRAYLQGSSAGSILQVVSHVPSLIPLSDRLNIEDANIQKPNTNNQKPHYLYTFL